MDETGFKAKLACDVSIGPVSVTDRSPKIRMQMHCRLDVGSFLLPQGINDKGNKTLAELCFPFHKSARMCVLGKLV